MFLRFATPPPWLVTVVRVILPMISMLLIRPVIPATIITPRQFINAASLRVVIVFITSVLVIILIVPATLPLPLPLLLPPLPLPLPSSLLNAVGVHILVQGWWWTKGRRSTDIVIIAP